MKTSLARLGHFARACLLLVAALWFFACSSAVRGGDTEVQEQQQALTTALYQINCGGGALSPFAADQFASGGATWTENATVSTSGVTNAAPAGVYQSERYGNHSYTFGSLTPGASYIARLHFAETKYTAVGARVFNVVINGAQVLTNFDIFVAGGTNKAVVRDFNATASGSGQITVQYVTLVDNAKSSGIEILSVGGTGNQAPTVATAASANPNPTTGTTTALSVLGADDAGEANLTYTWATVGTPPAAVSFSLNGSNAAKSTTATFSQAGSYSLSATIRDASGASVTSNVNVVVSSAGTGSAVYRVNCGGGALSPFAADQFASGGATWTENATVTTSGVTNAAPAGVYQSERYGNHSYAFGSLTPGATYTARLHFAETKYTAVGARVFNVVINGSQVLTNFDIFAAGGTNKAVVRDFNATASGSGQITVQYVTLIDNAKSSGIEILSTGGTGNQAPTVATAAAANPNPTTGTTTALSALGADDAGEANLTYTWATVGTPPAAVSFSLNGSNAAKSTTATFSQAGSYSLSATIRDASGASATSNVNVVVNQKLTSISVTPTSAQVPASGTQQFSASGNDQFARAMATQPSVAWTVSGGGTINATGVFTAGSTSGGPFTVSATSSAVVGTASVTVAGGAGSAVYRTNCGGGAISPFTADQYSSGGSTWTENVTVSTAGVTNAAPAGVYQSERYGNHSYAFSSLTPGASYTVRLHFAETKYATAGARVFNVVINGAQVLTNFDIFAAGGRNNAVVRDFNATASGSGQITVQYVTVADNAKSSGIEILSVGGTGNQAPTVATAAAANPNPTTGTTTALSVLGADDAGEANLTYTWATVGTPPAAVSFSLNGSNAAKSTTATFSQAGSYSLSATIRDASGASIASNVNVVVNQTGSVSYATDFNLTESSISEGGVWRQLGVDWTRVVTANGFAFGTQTGLNGFNDSYAYLSAAYPPNQSASAIIHLESGINVTYLEVEILLRWTDSAHYATGYECNLAFNGQYATIGRWPGPLGTDPSQFTTLAFQSVPQGVHDGDVFQADIIGNVITSRLNGQVIATGTDNAITSGSPGIGFYSQGGPASQKFSFTHFSATGL